MNTLLKFFLHQLLPAGVITADHLLPPHFILYHQQPPCPPLLIQYIINSSLPVFFFFCLLSRFISQLICTILSSHLQTISTIRPFSSLLFSSPRSVHLICSFSTSAKSDLSILNSGNVSPSLRHFVVHHSTSHYTPVNLLFALAALQHFVSTVT